MGEHFKGPWKVGHEALEVLAPHPKGAYVGGFTKVCDIRSWGFLTGKGALALPHDEAVAIQTANARLIAAAPEMLAALEAVNKLVGEAAMTGFNCHDGDWAERLFLSQQATSAAIKKAGGRLGSKQSDPA